MPPKSELIKNLVADGRALRASDFRDAGVSSSELTRSIERGDVVQWARGIYCGPDLPNGMSYAAVTLRHPGGVVCMQSAAAIHGISDLNPSQVWYAIDRSKNRAAPTGVNRDPVRMLSWTGPAMTVGVGPMKFAGVDVLVTNAARTVVDLLRRSIKAGAVGNEQTMKALSDFVREGGDLDDVWEYAKALGCLEQIEPIVHTAAAVSTPKI